MPVPLIIGGIVAGLAALGGIGGHMSAKETNEKAQRIAQNAQDIYNNAKSTLEHAQKETESSLLTLGYLKQNILNGSIQQFLQAYERIKNIELSDSVGLHESSNFEVDKQAALQLREMSDDYQSSIKSGVAGAATGAVIALAASGSLPIVTGVLSTSGTALVAGEVGVAASLAGSALSFGAAMTPLAAIAAPVVLFTGISASIKADENLEKANAMYAEAEVAVEKMKTSATLCRAITKRSNMFSSLLKELDGMFSECTNLLDAVTLKKTDAKKLTEGDLKLVAVTRSLAGAVKAIIDTPILSENGDLTYESEKVYNDLSDKIPNLNESVVDVTSSNYSVKIKSLPNEPTRNNSSVRIKALLKKKIKNNNYSRKVSAENAIDIMRGISALIIGVAAAVFIFLSVTSNQLSTFISVTFSIAAYAIPTLLIINNNTKVGFFKLVKGVSCLASAAEFGIVLYFICKEWINFGFFWWIDIPLIVLSLILLSILIGHNATSSFKQFAIKITACIFFLTIAPILFVILSSWIGVSFTISITITEIIYAFFALASVFGMDSQ